MRTNQPRIAKKETALNGALRVAPSARSRNATEVAAGLIRNAIIEGRLRSGQRLKAADLADELGLSRTPVREAFLVLQGEGLVTLTPNRGASVRTYSATDINDLYELRAVLEGLAARLAAGLATPPQITRLQDSCRRLAGLRVKLDVPQLVKENAVFHDAILRIAGSQRLNVTMSLVDLPHLYRAQFWYSAPQKESSEKDHASILRALERTDGDAAEAAMRAHLLRARDFLVEQLTSAAEE